MAHRITAPAMQRAQRLLEQRVQPFVHTDAVEFVVEATPETFESVGFAAAVGGPRSAFTIGSKWGTPWHTTWFRLTATVPEQLGGRPLHAVIDLGFRGRGDGFETEALVYRDGRVLHAIQPDRRTVDLGTLGAGEPIELWVEAAATPIIAGHEFGYGPTLLGDPATAPQRPIYQLRRAELACFNPEVNALAVELHAVIDLTVDMDARDPQRPRLFAALEAAGNALDVADPVGTADAARAELAKVLRVGNGPGAHRIVATGHAHLDTAWLWPIRETRRKALRTFANAVNLLDRNPDAVYCHSQAQHYAWVAQDAPELFARITQLVAEGRWEPVGGMWVETDLNLPDGESLLRQMVQGQRAFRGWFGLTCNGAFLPDDFGYPAGLPQIVNHGGAQWFFTQKLSWNETNRFPHHTFWWEGLDGSRVFTHFSPVDTYNALNLPSQFRFAERNFSDHVGASTSLVLYGHGDGGGGPTQAMIDRARLAADLNGVPRVTMGKVADFFADSIDEYGADAPVWVGEMYFEKHRGTYSTQIGTKQGNRRSEQLLHEIEVWSALAGSRPGRIDEWWQRVLTQQFHDIIPGSSIAWVHDDAEAEHAAIAEEIGAEVRAVLAPTGKDTTIMNPSSAAFSGVIDVDGVPVHADIPAFGWSSPSPTLPADGTTCVQVGGDITVTGGGTSFTIDSNGTLTSIVHNGRDIIPADDFAGFVLRADTPAEYDNWDIDMADANRTAEFVAAAGPPTVVEQHALRTTVECTYGTGASTWTVRYSLTGSGRIDITLDADWHESERRMQWRVPTDIHSHEAVCGTQFGHVRRARHGNTSWDIARFEVCAHRYVAVAEPGFGMAIMADGPHGYDVRNDALQLTVMRSPRFPDPEADRGRQHVEWAVRPLDSLVDVAPLEEEAETLSHPPRVVPGSPTVPNDVVSWNVPGVLISALKPADDGSGDIIIRAWETTGGRRTGSFDVTGTRSAVPCDALEDPVAPALDRDGTGYAVTLGAFEIVTLRLTR
ncbi:MAG: Mannosylglycerate hydrolase [Actinomycetota bacterium]